MISTSIEKDLFNKLVKDEKWTLLYHVRVDLFEDRWKRKLLIEGLPTIEESDIALAIDKFSPGIHDWELKALKGMEGYLHKIDYIYTEVNSDYVYEGCALIGEIDDYLHIFGLKRVETKWCGDYRWGDAFYIRS